MMNFENYIIRYQSKLGRHIAVNFGKYTKSTCPVVHAVRTIIYYDSYIDPAGI